MDPLDDLDPQLQEKLKVLQSCKERDADMAARGKARYLAQARQLAVTYTGLTRLNHWIENIKFLFRRKENAPMFSTIISVFLILATLLGGSGVTVAAAQSSQPGDFLYPVKTFSEDAYYQITFGDQNRLNLLLDYADRRVAEIDAILAEGQVPPPAVPLRLENHLQSALELSVKDIESADDLLQQIHVRIEETLNNRLGVPNPDAAGEELRLHVRDILQVRIRWIDEGLEQLTQLQQHTQNQIQTQQQDEPGQNGEVPGSTNGTGAGQMPNYQYGVGEWSWGWVMTPTPTDMLNQYQHGNGGQGGSGSGNGK